jgi:hypothetical protein
VQTVLAKSQHQLDDRGAILASPGDRIALDGDPTGDGHREERILTFGLCLNLGDGGIHE